MCACLAEGPADVAALARAQSGDGPGTSLDCPSLTGPRLWNEKWIEGVATAALQAVHAHAYMRKHAYACLHVIQ